VSTSPLLLYDGNCGFCSASVQFVLRHEQQHTLRFAALDSDAGRQIRARHPDIASVDSMIWVDYPFDTARERVTIRSAAGLKIASYMGGIWWLAALGWIVPRPVRDAVYDVIARHRHRLVSDDQCYIPPPAVRARFLDSRS
jgi:predicted DCC family thiol-disulfide oxidoreductase YuxK